jgi:hypothetical protein
MTAGSPAMSLKSTLNDRVSDRLGFGSRSGKLWWWTDSWSQMSFWDMNSLQKALQIMYSNNIGSPLNTNNLILKIYEKTIIRRF